MADALKIMQDMGLTKASKREFFVLTSIICQSIKITEKSGLRTFLGKVYIFIGFIVMDF